MALIELKENNNDKNLEILKNFYSDVFQKYEEYLENDNALYFIFNPKNNNFFSDNVKGFILNEMYSAMVKSKDLFQVINAATNKKNDYDSNNNRYPSFRSKFEHWKNEVNTTNEASPINDSHVRNMLNKYGIEKIKYISSNYSDSQKILKEAVDKFIKKFLNKEGTNRIELKTDFHDSISIYRLVDKFLWLQGKIEKLIDFKTKQSEYIENYKILILQTSQIHDA